MKLENYEVHLPSYSIGNAIYDKIGPLHHYITVKFQVDGVSIA